MNTENEKDVNLLFNLNMDNYIDWIMSKDSTDFWTKPTDFEKDNFPVWRSMEYERLMKFHEWKKEGSVLTIEIIKNDEIQRIIDLLNDSVYELEVLDNVINGSLVNDFYNLANVTATIDYLKFLKSGADDAVSEVFKKIESKDEIQELALQNDNQRLVLLYKLGIIDYLKEKYPATLSTGTLTSLIRLITNIETRPSSINASLKKIGNGELNDPVNPKAVNRVNSELQKIGIDLTTKNKPAKKGG